MTSNSQERTHCLSVDGAIPPEPSGSVVSRDGEVCYRIENYSSMPPFLVSLTSPSDHWMFLSTTGGITAGRKNSDHALFPYATEDQIADGATTTGGVTIILVRMRNTWVRWEPFSSALAGIYSVSRAVEKNSAGNVISFEETNADLGLTFRQTWTNSPEFGVVRICSVSARGGEPTELRILDGIRNTLPADATAAFQASFSVLLDAYKRSELLPESGLGVFGLSAVPTDNAEPSEALAATTWWQRGLHADKTLLSAQQLDLFRKTGMVEAEHDVKGKRGALIVVSDVTLQPDSELEWLFCGEVDQQASEVVALDAQLREPGSAIITQVKESVNHSRQRLITMLSRNDGIQATGNQLTQIHHAANVTYNTMRGGYFAYGYQIPLDDFTGFVRRRNAGVASLHGEFLRTLDALIRVDDLRRKVDACGDANLSRLTLEYLPLTFSRRHGDPSRPWNRFSIENEDPDGSPRLAYQGNWRDIFQNWEALLHSAPLYITHVVAKFLNATTVDGYNPYRITDAGVDWEKPEPDSPWANIGYWGDHQIIYLQKLLELSERYQPGALTELLHKRWFTHADVPYRIAGFEAMLANPYETISFDEERDALTARRTLQIGADGKLVHDADGAIVHVSLLEKLILLALAKAANIVPDAGIWMNTQRPEWNDANNALVGKGVSVVTAAYLERFAGFADTLLGVPDSVVLSVETAGWLEATVPALKQGLDHGPHGWNAAARLEFMRRGGTAAQRYRETVSTDGLSGRTTNTPGSCVLELFRAIRRLCAQIIELNRRDDELYHSYNTISIARDDEGRVTGVEVHRLYEMLEGQVAALSSDAVAPAACERTLAALRSSRLYRQDQHSYMLYPNRELPGFAAKNQIPAESATSSSALRKLLQDPQQQIAARDVDGGVHFLSRYRNAMILEDAVRSYAKDSDDPAFGRQEVEEILAIYESTFRHQEFTGRSGTFYGYEGLGSVYWHMVSKLLLAAQENALEAHRAGDEELAARLRDHYYEIRAGIGFNKSPDAYGAFPTDPYSHTPFGGGARQPGMTGQVKEEVIARFAELGLVVRDGRISFDPFLVESNEFLTAPARLVYAAASGDRKQLEVPSGSYAFTFCQTPIMVARAASPGRPNSADYGITVHRTDGGEESGNGLELSPALSNEIFTKTGTVAHVVVRF